MISRSIKGLRNGMSPGFESRSSIRHHALRKSVVTETVDRAGLSAGGSNLWNSSRLRNSRTIAISNLSEMARQGSASLASDTRVTAGISIEVSRYRDES